VLARPGGSGGAVPESATAAVALVGDGWHQPPSLGVSKLPEGRGDEGVDQDGRGKQWSERQDSMPEVAERVLWTRSAHTHNLFEAMPVASRGVGCKGGLTGWSSFRWKDWWTC
jgi:hypothetical protein